MVCLKKCQKNVPRHCDRHGSWRNETRGRILAVCVAKNPCSSGTEKMSPMPPGRRELPVQWARPERTKVVSPVFGCRSVSYTFLVFGVLISQQKRSYIMEIFSSERISVRLVCGWYTVRKRRSVCDPHILGVNQLYIGGKLSVY